MNASFFRISCALAGGVLMLSQTSPAAGEPTTDQGWYVEGGIANVNVSTELSGFTVDSDKGGWSLGVGYMFNKNLSLLGSYHNLGDNYSSTDCPPPRLCLIESNDEIDFSGVSLSAVGAWPVTDIFEVYGKLGVMRWDADFSRFALDRSGEALVYGAGISVSPSPAWRVRLQYEAFNLDAESASLALSYRF